MVRRRCRNSGIPPEYDNRNFEPGLDRRETLLRMIFLTDNADRCEAFCNALRTLDDEEREKARLAAGLS